MKKTSLLRLVWKTQTERLYVGKVYRIVVIDNSNSATGVLIPRVHISTLKEPSWFMKRDHAINSMSQRMPALVENFRPNSFGSPKFSNMIRGEIESRECQTCHERSIVEESCVNPSFRCEFDIRKGSLVDSPPRGNKQSVIQDRIRRLELSERENGFNVYNGAANNQIKSFHRSQFHIPPSRKSRPVEPTQSNQRCRSVWVISSFHMKSSEGDRIPVNPEEITPEPPSISKLSKARRESRLRRQSLILDC